MSPNKNPKAPVKYQVSTPPFNFLYGAFNLNKWRIPYFMVNMTIAEAAEYLRLPSELPGAEDIDWKIDELFQRDIDWKRVKSGLVNNYLSSKDHPHFFNSLTIALLPFDNVNNDRLDEFDEGHAWQAPEMGGDYEKTLSVGPIRLGFWDESAEPDSEGFLIGRVQWNPKQIFGVAIDGQHRLAALKLLVESHATQIDQTRVPIILLILDKRLGYVNPDDRPIVEMLRALFIDLNKHAQTVSRARQILLDDRDAHAYCVRQLMGLGLSADISELTAQSPRLPLAIVDWHSEQAKFDVGPYLTTVLGLDWLVTQILGRAPSDYTSYPSIRTYLKLLERWLDVDLEDALDRLAQLELFKLAPFSFEDEELKRIGLAFGALWSTGICHIMSELRPYANVLSVRASDDSFSREFQNWFVLRERAKADGTAIGRPARDLEEFLSQVEQRSENPIPRAMFEEQLERIEELKGSSLAFNVVFQRGMLLAYLDFAKVLQDYIGGADESDDDILDEIFEELDEMDPEDTESLETELSDSGEVEAVERGSGTVQLQYFERAKEFCLAMNMIVDAWPELLSIGVQLKNGESGTAYVWAGSLRNPAGSIDFTQAASNRARDLLLLLVGMVVFSRASKGDKRPSFVDVWSELESPDSALFKILKSRLNLWSKESGGGGKRLKERDWSYDSNDAQDEAYWILKGAWTRVGL